MRLIILLLLLAPLAYSQPVNIRGAENWSESPAPGAPAAGLVTVYARDVGGSTTYCMTNSAGVERCVNNGGLALSSMYATGGVGTKADPWVYAAGNPWGDALGDGFDGVLMDVGWHAIDDFPATIPLGAHVVRGFGRGLTFLLPIDGGTHTSPPSPMIRSDNDVTGLSFGGFTVDGSGGITGSNQFHNAIRLAINESEVSDIDFQFFGAALWNPLYGGTQQMRSMEAEFLGSINAGTDLTFNLDLEYVTNDPTGVVVNYPSTLSATDAAAKAATDLNASATWTNWMHAYAVGTTLHAIPRQWMKAAPATWEVLVDGTPDTGLVNPTSAIDGQGGNYWLQIDNNSFNVVVSRIRMPGSYRLINGIGVGANTANAITIADSRFSGGASANWGIRYLEGTSIQNVHVTNFVAEGCFGGVEVHSAFGGSIRGLYNESTTTHGIRVADLHGISSNPRIKGLSIINGKYQRLEAVGVASGINVTGGQIDTLISIDSAVRRMNVEGVSVENAATSQVNNSATSSISGWSIADQAAFTKGTLTTKGDVLVHNGTDVVRVAVGANDQVLTADSAQAAGVKWAAASGGGLGDPGANGYVVRTALDTTTARTITGSNGITVTNGDGQSGNTDISNETFATRVFWRDEFLATSTENGEIGDMGWTFAGGDVVCCWTGTDDNHPGTVRIRSTSANLNTNIQMDNTSWNFSANFDIHWIIQGTATDASNTLIRIGAMNGSGDPPVRGVYVEKLFTDTNLFCVSRDASSETRTDMGVTYADATWYTFRVRRVNGTTVGCTINGGSETTINTNVPTDSARMVMQVESNDTTQRGLYGDMAQFEAVVSR